MTNLITIVRVVNEKIAITCLKVIKVINKISKTVKASGDIN